MARTRRRIGALGLGISLGVTFSPGAVHAQPVRRFALEVTPGAPCVTRASLTGYLQALFGGDPLATAQPAPDTVMIEVRGRDLLQVTLLLRRGSAARAEHMQRLRERAARCEQLLASVASALHEHLAPPPAAPSPPPSEPRHAPSSTVRAETLREVVVRERVSTSRVAVSSELAAPPRDGAARRLGLRFALETYGAWGVLPSLSGGVRFAASVRIGRPEKFGLAVGVGARLDLPVSIDHAGRSLETHALGGDLLVCARWRALDACAVAHLGVSSSQLVNNAAGAETTPRWALGAQVGGTLRLAGPLGLRGSVEALAVPVQTTQRIGAQVVWTSPHAGVTAGLGLVLDFL